MAGKNKVEIRICGNDYTLVGAESEEYIQRVALFIDKKMNEILKVNSKLSTSMAAILTAINVADDFFKAYESESQLKKELKRTTDELDRLREEIRMVYEDNAALSTKNTILQLELAKRESELNEVRSTLDKTAKSLIEVKPF